MRQHRSKSRKGKKKKDSRAQKVYTGIIKNYNAKKGLGEIMTKNGATYKFERAAQLARVEKGDHVKFRVHGSTTMAHSLTLQHSPIDKNPIEQNSLNEFDLEQLINKKRNNDIPVIMNIQNILNKDSNKKNKKKKNRRRKRKRKTEPIISIDLVDSPPLDFSQFPIYPIPTLEKDCPISHTQFNESLRLDESNCSNHNNNNNNNNNHNVNHHLDFFGNNNNENRQQQHHRSFNRSLSSNSSAMDIISTSSTTSRHNSNLSSHFSTMGDDGEVVEGSSSNGPVGNLLQMPYPNTKTTSIPSPQLSPIPLRKRSLPSPLLKSSSSHQHHHHSHFPNHHHKNSSSSSSSNLFMTTSSSPTSHRHHRHNNNPFSSPRNSSSTLNNTFPPYRNLFNLNYQTTQKSIPSPSPFKQQHPFHKNLKNNSSQHHHNGTENHPHNHNNNNSNNNIKPSPILDILNKPTIIDLADTDEELPQNQSLHGYSKEKEEYIQNPRKRKRSFEEINTSSFLNSSSCLLSDDWSPNRRNSPSPERAKKKRRKTSNLQRKFQRKCRLSSPDKTKIKGLETELIHTPLQKKQPFDHYEHLLKITELHNIDMSEDLGLKNNQYFIQVVLDVQKLGTRLFQLKQHCWDKDEDHARQRCSEKILQKLSELVS